MATDFVKWRKYLKPGEWKVMRDRVECKPRSEPIPTVQSQRDSRIQDTWTPRGRGQSHAGNRRIA